MSKAIPIILYLSNGYPSLEHSVQMAKEYADAGCRMIEIDFPARNPYLEGDVIADRMKKALAHCDDYDRYMESILTVQRSLPDVQLIVLAYEETVLEIGEEKFIRFCLDHDLKDIILVGLSSNALKDRMMRRGLQISCYVQFQLPEDEIQSAIGSNGFVYMQAKAKPGQGYVNELYPTLKDCIAHLRNRGIDRPVYCGVGIHSPADAAAIRDAGEDGIFVGSAVFNLHNDIPEMKKLIRAFITSTN